MRKRLLSLFLAVIMILLAVPTLAIVSLAEEAGTGTENKVVYSTSFSNDPTSENFPSIDLPAATDESTYVWNGLDFSGVGNFNEDGSFKSGNYKAGAITYKGNWEIGTIGVDWDAKGTAAPTVNVTSFYPYTDFYRASKSEICITTGNAIWGTGNAVQSGGLWLNSARNSMVAGIVYEKLDATPVETPSNNDGNASKVTAYVGTAAVRYTTEYAGTIDISAVAGVAYRNGVSLVILHNGTVVHTVNNADMTTNDGGKDLGTVKSGLAVEKGDTVDFVCLGDVNYDADSFEAAKEAAAYQGDAFDYNKAKRGIREFDFTVNYSAIAGSEYSSTFGPGYEYPVVDLDTNTITSYPDAWKVGAFDATATKTTVTNEDETTTRTDWSAVTVGNKFTAYDKVDRSSGYAITSAIGGGTWGSAAGGYGGALWMGTGYTNSFSVGVNYSGSDPRTVNSIYAVSGAVYTAEYAGDITVDFSVGYTITNGTRLLIRHNGVDVQIYEHGTETGSVKITGVCTGDTIEFVCIPDLNFDADSYTYYGYEYFLYSGTSPDYKVSTHAKMGVKLKSFKVTYDVGYGIDSTSSWDGDDYTVTKVADKINTIQSNPDYFLFRWYTNGADGVQGNADDVPVTAVNSAAAGTITYAKINPYLMSEDTAGITSGMTYKEAFEKYVAFMKTLLRIDYAGDWTMAYDNNGEVSPIRYLLLVAQDNPFMLSSTDNQIASFAQAGYMVDEIEFERAMKTYYDNTFKNYDLAATSTLSFTAETLVSDIKVTYEKTGLTKVKGGGQHLYQGATNNSGTYATTLDLYLRPTDNVPSATVAMAYTASFSGKLTLSLDSFNWITEDLYPYVAIGVFKNGKAVTLNTEGLTLSSLATAMPTENNAANNTTAGNLQALETGLFYNATTGYYHLKLAASDTSVVKTNAAYTADSGDAFFVDLQKLFANTTINVAKGDEITIRIDRSNAYDNLLSKQERPTKLQLGLTAKTEASATIGATLEIYDDYAINLYVTPHNSTAEGAGIIVKDENGNPVTLLGVKQTNGSYKVTAKEDILIYELVYHNGSGYTGGTTVAYTPYEFGPDGVYTYYEKTVNTFDLLDD
ncbi:MAG: hypothetical protein IJ012_01925 [Clostridia bacterium]|nr:hypothetical protein [Clostridia bacterium]